MKRIASTFITLSLLASSAFATSVSSVAPNSGPSGGANTVVITGTGFTGATVVKFGANPATSFLVASDTQINAVAPAGAVGSVVALTINAPAGNLVTGAIYTYAAAAAPTVTSVSPNVGGLTGGTVVYIVGTNFDNPPVTTVSFGANPVVPVRLSGTLLQAAVPSSGLTAPNSSTVAVSATNAQGTSPAATNPSYTYIADINGNSRSVQVNVTVTVGKSAGIQWGDNTTIDDNGFDHTLAAQRLTAYNWTAKDPSYGTSITTGTTYLTNDLTNAKNIYLANTSATFSQESISAIVSNTTYWTAGVNPGANIFTMKAQMGANAQATLSSTAASLGSNLIRGADQALVLEFDSPTTVSSASVGATQMIAVTLTATAP